jgi:predicted GTPase
MSQALPEIGHTTYVNTMTTIFRLLILEDWCSTTTTESLPSLPTQRLRIKSMVLLGVVKIWRLSCNSKIRSELFRFCFIFCSFRIAQQALIALHEAHVCLFVVDAIAGPQPMDVQVASWLRKLGFLGSPSSPRQKNMRSRRNKIGGHVITRNCKVYLVANKCESPLRGRILAHDFWSLGIPSPANPSVGSQVEGNDLQQNGVFPVSALHGDGVGDLLDHIYSNEHLPRIMSPAVSGLTSANDNHAGTSRFTNGRVNLFPVDEDMESSTAGKTADNVATSKNEAAVTINVALIGRVNVGKSSLFNRFLGSNRSIVSACAGTTRDSIDSEIVRNTAPSRRYRLLDTAGIRNRNRIDKVYDAVPVCHV